MKRIKRPLVLVKEQLRIVTAAGMCSTGAPSGTCPTMSNYCGATK